MMSTARLVERGRALGAWEAAGGSGGRLVLLDRKVRIGACSDFPPGGRVRADGTPLPEWRSWPPPGFEIRGLRAR